MTSHYGFVDAIAGRSYVKYVLIMIVLMLSAGSFMNLILDETANVNTALYGDSRLQVMWGLIDFVILAVCFLHGRQLFYVASQQPLILAFVGYGALSSIWSDDPQLTMRRTLGLVCTTAFGFFLGMRFELRVLLRMLALILAISMVASVAAAILFPSVGIMTGIDGGAWRGVFVHKNVMARVVGLAMLIFTCLLWEYRQNRILYGIPILLGVGLLLFSRSMTSVVVTVLTFCLGMYRRLRLRPVQAVAALALVLLLGLIVVVALQGQTDLVFALMGRDSTLTGRTKLWEYSIDAVMQRPFLGAGWDVFWGGPEGDRIRSMVGWAAPHAHNAFLDMALNVGLIGMTIFLAGLFDCLRRALRYSYQLDRPFNLWPLLFYSYMFFYMFTETTLVDRHSLVYILYCAISVSMNVSSPARICDSATALNYSPPIPSIINGIQEF